MNPNAPRALTFSTRLYQALLAVYPSEFRREYGGPMLQVFRDSARRALREAGAAGLLALWGRMLLDTVQAALEEHSRRGVEMSKEKFIKLSGWALMLGGLVMILGWLATMRPEYSTFNGRSLLIDRVANAAEIPLFVMGQLLLSLGLTGLYLRYGPRASSLGRFGLVLGALSGVVGAAGAIGLGIQDSNPWWSMFFFGMTIQYLGLALFGLANLRQRSLPRWNGVPVLAGIWIPLYVFLGLSIEQATGMPVDLPPVASILLLLLSLAGLAGLGYQMQSDARPAGTPAGTA